MITALAIKGLLVITLLIGIINLAEFMVQHIQDWKNQEVEHD